VGAGGHEEIEYEPQRHRARMETLRIAEFGLRIWKPENETADGRRWTPIEEKKNQRKPFPFLSALIGVHRRLL
jgi:hypothetical protein